MEMKYIEYGIVFLAVVALSWAFLLQPTGHLPDKYASCLRQVEPALLQKATGKTLQQIIGG
ncbi:hypothetical protein HZC09_00560 [Candidatus Micrarchaeota archaeon]|nr:hypothetical protein [Candidatus Micrarchaeota archaeon]